jgi:triosephosphate isomerase (TIM)
MIYIANWKQNKSQIEVDDWLRDFLAYKDSVKFSESDQVVICPPALYLKQIHDFIKGNQLNLAVGAQDVSVSLEGSHTGELGVFQIADYADYCIVGHSERRSMGETPEQINQKIDNLLEYNLNPIVCFSSVDEFNAIRLPDVNEDNILYAFEPISAIGTGNPADPKLIEEIFAKTGLQSLIYGGSVNPINISQYKSIAGIEGFLVGNASLSCRSFLDLI